ncbi:hypothetical protein AGMMS49546_36550 [Spirochaetia bacterium]|nr:hypothetical protein AGMMS49546_36550 [Spirochaetia bacterium]
MTNLENRIEYKPKVCGNTVLRQELHAFLDVMPEQNLAALKPLFTVLSIDPVIIETDLTAEEKEIIAAGENDYREHPETFTRLQDI